MPRCTCAAASGPLINSSRVRRRSRMSQTTLKLSVFATLLLLTGGISAQAADETFTVRIENVSAANALKLSNGKTEPVGVAPVLYLVHTNRAPLFTSGEPDRGKGLEALAEDGPTARHRPCGFHQHSRRGRQSRRHLAGAGVRVQGRSQTRRAADLRHDVRPVK